MLQVFSGVEETSLAHQSNDLGVQVRRHLRPDARQPLPSGTSADRGPESPISPQVFPTVAVCSATEPLQTWYRVYSNADYIFAALFEAHCSPEAARFSHAQCHEVGPGTAVWRDRARAAAGTAAGTLACTRPPACCSTDHAQGGCNSEPRHLRCRCSRRR